MGGFQSNHVSVTQAFYNNITQANQQSCTASSTVSQNGNVIIINGDKINGNFGGVVNDISTDASCTITSAMDNIVQDILQATATQTNKSASDMFGDFSFHGNENNFNVNQFVVNNITQINEATCAASSVVSQNGNYIYVSNSVINGNFLGVSNKSSTNANCVMTNTMKNSTYNSAQSSADQSNSSKGMFVAMAGAIVCVVLMIIVVIGIMFFTGSLKGMGAAGANKVKDEQQKLIASNSVTANKNIPTNRNISTGKSIPTSKGVSTGRSSMMIKHR